MKKLFLAMLLATSAIGVAPSQELSAHERSKHHVYGSFYTTAATPIDALGNVPFEFVTAQSKGVNISSGNIWIERPGDYLVTYGVTINSPTEFQLYLNEVAIAGTQQPQGPGLYHPLSTIIHVENANSILSVIASTATSLQNTVSGDTSAYLTILKVN